MREPRTQQAREAMIASYRAVTREVERLPGAELLRPSRCLGWTVADLLYHMLLDAQRALVTFATPSERAPDVDFVTYWRPFKPGSEGSAEHGRFVRLVSSAYSSPRSIVRQWSETATAAAHVARDQPEGAVSTQGHSLDAGDFMATLAVEATVHHLDLIGDDPDAIGPDGAGLAWTRRTLDGLLGVELDAWDDVNYVLKATGRVGLTAEEEGALGHLAARLPILG